MDQGINLSFGNLLNLFLTPVKLLNLFLTSVKLLNLFLTPVKLLNLFLTPVKLLNLFRTSEKIENHATSITRNLIRKLNSFQVQLSDQF